MKNNASDNNAVEVARQYGSTEINSKAAEENYQPFVNEECGDTMWDAVLEQEEKRSGLKNILFGKQGNEKK